MSQFANPIKIAAVLTLSAVNGPAAEPDRQPSRVPERAISDRQTQALERREDARANAALMQGVRAALKADQPVAALGKIIPEMNDPVRQKTLQTLRAEEKADLLSVKPEDLAKLMKLQDPKQAKPALEKALYVERSLDAAKQIRDLIDRSLKDGVDTNVFEKIRGIAGNLKHEMPGLLTNGSYASDQGFRKDLQSLLDKMPKDNPGAYDLAVQNHQVILKQFYGAR